MLPPLTPATTFKMPPKPPQSVSPNTNLRNHRNNIRQLVGSPIRNVQCLEDALPWSPTAFNLNADSTFDIFDDFTNGNNSFELFAPDAADVLSGISYGSPEKPLKRPRLDRASTGSVLGEITSSNVNTFSVPTGNPFGKSRNASPTRAKSPGYGNILGLSQEDIFAPDFFADVPEDISGVDILQGFQKIGSGTHKEKNGSSRASATSSRPGMGRSFTSRF
jgi:forkhead transcription factor HCM1